MNIRILCIGTLKETYWKQAQAEYIRRLSAYCKLTIVEKKESWSDDILEEGRAMLRHIKKTDYVITLEIHGKERSSEELAQDVAQLALHGHSNLTFVIGGSNGLSEEVTERADDHLSFSPLTFPHQLMRILLLEQIYRSFKIIRHETYHK